MSDSLNIASVGDSPAAARLTSLLLALFVVFLSVAAYYNTLSMNFVNWDDHKLILDNSYIRGLTSENLRHIWTKPILETYLPLRVTSYAVDYWLWDLDPKGFHLTNVILHAFCALLVFSIVARLVGSLVPAFFAGALFAVHPVHTEAVAWVSGRKDVLSTALFLLAYLLYVRSIAPGARRLPFILASLAFFILSGLAKAMVVTLPLLVILTDCLFGEGLAAGRWKRLLPVWVAYFAAAALVTAIAVHFAASAGAIRPYHFGGPAKTAVFMTWTALYYIKTMLFPHALSARYPYGDTGDFGVSNVLVYASPVVLLVVLAASLWLFARALAGRKTPAPLSLKLSAFGVWWFFLTLLPVMNFVSINVLVADRYLYLPSAGFLVAVAAVLWFLWREGVPAERARVPRVAAAVLCALLVASDGVKTYARNEVWRNSISLWRSVVREFPESQKARLQLASAYADAPKPDYEKALAEVDAALRLAPDSGEPYLVRGKILSKMGRSDEAAADFDRARELGLPGRADMYDTYLSEAAALEAAGKFDEAAASLEKAVSVEPSRPQAYNNLGHLAQMRKDASAAEALYQKALAADARFAPAWYNLGVLAAQKRDFPAAAGYYMKALEADPSFAEAMVNLAVIRLDAGRLAAALPLLETAVRVRPALLPAHVSLARAYALAGDYDAARKELEAALAIEPGNQMVKDLLEKFNAMTKGGN